MANKSAEVGQYNINNSLADYKAKVLATDRNLEQVVHTIKIYGDPKIRAGYFINLDMPKPTNPDGEIEKDEVMSGKYLVVSVVHKFTKEGLYTHLKVMRDSLIRKGANPPKELYDIQRGDVHGRGQQTKEDLQNGGGTGAGSGNATSRLNIERAAEQLERFAQDGFTQGSAAGIMGNVLVESNGLRLSESGTSNRGWIKWTGSRLRNFERYANDRGLSTTDPETNYQYLIYEMEGNDGDYFNIGYTLDELKTIEDPEEAAEYFLKGYDRPVAPSPTRRKDAAKQILEGMTNG